MRVSTRVYNGGVSAITGNYTARAGAVARSITRLTCQPIKTTQPARCDYLRWRHRQRCHIIYRRWWQRHLADKVLVQRSAAAADDEDDDDDDDGIATIIIIVLPWQRPEWCAVFNYRAMHFSAYARSWDRMSSVCPSISNVGWLWSHRLEILETNYTDN